MDRRSFFRGAGLATVAAAASGLAAPAISQGRKELRLAMPWARDFPGLGTGAQRLAERINNMTDGRYTVAIYAAGELVPALQEFAAVSDGRADMYHAPDYYYASVNPALSFFTNAPLGLTATEHSAWIDFGGGQELWDELSGQYGIKPFLIGHTGTQLGGWFKRPVTGLADLQGLNFRMPGIGGQVWAALGMNIVALPASGILAALEAGTLDGADWVGPWNDLSLGLYQAAPHVYYPTLAEGTGAVAVGLSRSVWEGMSGADRAAFRAVFQAETSAMLSDYTINNARSLAALRTDHQIVPEPFPADVLARIAEVAPAIAAASAADDLGRRIHDAYYGARDLMRPWSAIAEGQFIASRASLLG